MGSGDVVATGITSEITGSMPEVPEGVDLLRPWTTPYDKEAWAAVGCGGLEELIIRWQEMVNGGDTAEAAQLALVCYARDGSCPSNSDNNAYQALHYQFATVATSRVA